MRIYKIKVNGKTYEVKVMGITEVEPVEVKTETNYAASLNGAKEVIIVP